MSMRAALVYSALLMMPATASAASVDPVPVIEHRTLDAFGAAKQTCVEWTDGCAVCLRENASVNCSLPGIACQPGTIVCKSARAGKAP